MIHIYTGDGKGKTTAALGCALRALGHNKKVAVVQFLKPGIEEGEYKFSSQIDGFEIIPSKGASFIISGKITKGDIEAAENSMRTSEEAISHKRFDMVILDELNVALDLGLVEEARAINMIKGGSPNIEIIITGRDAPKYLIDLADIVSEIREIKHPYKGGAPSRKGIEY